MEDARKYETAKYVVSGVAFVLNAVLLIYLLTSQSTFRIRDFAQRLTPDGWPSLTVLAYFVVVGAIFTVIQLPLDFFSGYFLEHRFGLSRQTLWSWIFDQLKGLILGAVIGLLSAEIVYGLMRYRPDRWWIFAAIIFAALFVVLAQLAPVLLLPLFFKFTPVENAELRQRVDRLAQRARTQIRGLFEWSLGEKTRKANAAVVGWGRTRRIIVSDTLLQNFAPEEVEVIMAHELCHHVKAHIWWGIAVQSVLTFASFFAIDRVLHRFAGPFRGLSDVANFPVIALSGVAITVLMLPVVNGFSRWLEREADLYALEITGDALAFVSSMEKLGDLNMANKTPNKIIEFFFYSHPAIEKRIKLAADRVGQIV
jgi:STE24 endopeptidase